MLPCTQELYMKIINTIFTYCNPSEMWQRNMFFFALSNRSKSLFCKSQAKIMIFSESAVKQSNHGKTSKSSNELKGLIQVKFQI